MPRMHARCLECMPVSTHAAFNEVQKAVALTLQAEGKEAAGKGVLRELGFEAIGLYGPTTWVLMRGEWRDSNPRRTMCDKRRAPDPAGSLVMYAHVVGKIVALPSELHSQCARSFPSFSGRRVETCSYMKCIRSLKLRARALIRLSYAVITPEENRTPYCRS